jgi:hypothetical protein
MVSSLYALLSVVAIVHLAVWPFLQDPIYSAQRYGIARQPKLVGSAGVMCLVSAWPQSPVVRIMAKLMHLGCSFLSPAMPCGPLW